VSDLVVRRLLVDMETPIERLWCDGDAFRTAFLNALSMSFPVGEQFFIDAVRAGFKALPEAAQHAHRAEVQGFLGQEATHRRLHGLYNDHLERLGLENQWAPRALQRQTLFENADPRHALAVTAAYEHFTAVFADWILRRPHWLGRRDPRLATLWLWHSAEESEHRSTAFGLYRALGGDEGWRLRWFRKVSLIFVGDVLRQTAHNLKHEGQLWRWRTWASAASFLFGRDGLVRCSFGPWRDYFKPSFHPDQHDAQASRDWLEANRAVYQPVGAASAHA
jgi:predicted metal-dependent hydrolase